MVALPSVGDDFGEFHVTGVLGQGGMGVVYTAVQRRLGRTVALKVLSPRLIGDEQYRARFVREAETLARLDSPHIIHIYDYGDVDGCLFISTQLVRGGDLGEWLERHGPMPLELALELVEQVASALADAHDAGVIHRDVKPSNTLVREGGSPFAYLCDFGIAHVEDGDSTAGTVVGSWAYLAPERCLGSPATAVSDIYSVGCLMWAMLHGDPPFVGAHVQAAMSHVNQPVPQLPHPDEAGRRVNAILRRALAKDPAARYQRASDLAEDVRATADALRSQEPEGMPEPTVDPLPAVEQTMLRGPSTPVLPQPAPVPRRRRRRFVGVAALGVALLLAAVIGVGAVLLMRGSDEGSTATISGSTSAARALAHLSRVSYDKGKRSDVAIQSYEKSVGEVEVLLSKGDKLEASPTPWAQGLPTLGAVHRFNGDFDGDGLTDLAILTGAAAGGMDLTAYLSTGDGFNGARWTTHIPGVTDSSVYPISGDYDGDGHTDVALVSNKQNLDVRVLLSNGKSFLPTQDWHGSLDIDPDNTRVVPGDTNNDGKTDLVAIYQGASSSHVGVFLSQGNGFAAMDPNVVTLPAFVRIGKETPVKTLVGDFDGNQLSDLLVFVSRPGGGVDALFYGGSHDGLSHESTSWFSDAWDPGDSWLSMGDFDADGKQDVARIAWPEGRTDAGVWILHSTGDKLVDRGIAGTWAFPKLQGLNSIRTLNRIG